MNVGRKLRQTVALAVIRLSTSSRFDGHSFVTQGPPLTLCVAVLAHNKWGWIVVVNESRSPFNTDSCVSSFTLANVSWLLWMRLRKGFRMKKKKNKTHSMSIFLSYIFVIQNTLTPRAKHTHSYNKYYRLNLIRFRLVGHSMFFQCEKKKNNENIRRNMNVFATEKWHMLASHRTLYICIQFGRKDEPTE